MKVSRVQIPHPPLFFIHIGKYFGSTKTAFASAFNL